MILTNFDGSETASLRAMVNPMVSWIWAGGVMLLLGAIVTMWPSAREIRQGAVVTYSLGISRETSAKVYKLATSHRS